MELAALCFLGLWEATGKDLSRNSASSFSVTNFPLRGAEFDVQMCATDIWKYLKRWGYISLRWWGPLIRPDETLLPSELRAQTRDMRGQAEPPRKLTCPGTNTFTAL